MVTEQEGYQTKEVISGTMAMYVHYISLGFLPFSAEQECQITKFCVQYL